MSRQVKNPPIKGGHDGDVVALVADVTEGQLDVPHIAARLKSWVHEIPSLDGLL